MTARKRLFRVLLLCGTALAVGLVYACIVQRLGYGIPCVYKTLFGYDCPSCGISRMFLALFRGDVVAAFGYNPVILCLLPLWTVILARLAYLYVRFGQAYIEKWVCICTLSSFCVLFFYGFLRNWA